jgi:hypothetical protein
MVKERGEKAHSSFCYVGTDAYSVSEMLHLLFICEFVFLENYRHHPLRDRL